MTGVTVKSSDRVFTKLVTTEVEFAPMTQELIEWYLDRGESLDKAGGYAIQGAATAFVKRINGSHSNVIGLPMVETVELLRLAGVELTATNKSVFL
jgi:Nucleotide-binding protein implicated in inhibition of septum formation